MKVPLNFAALTLFATLPLVAQTHYCIGGNLDALTPTQIHTCQATMAQVRETVRQHGAPNGWHFLVVCDDDGWQDVAAMTGRAEARLRSAAYETDQAMQVTFLRQSSLLAADGGVKGLLRVVLNDLPNHMVPDGAAPIPNVQERREVPTQLLAEEHAPESTRQEEAALGQ